MQVEISVTLTSKAGLSAAKPHPVPDRSDARAEQSIPLLGASCGTDC